MYKNSTNKEIRLVNSIEKSVTRRWNTNDGKQIARRIIDSMQRGDIDAALDSVGEFEGRRDLRGLEFGNPYENDLALDVKVNAHEFKFVRSTIFTGLTLSSIDFSRANLEKTVWEDCVFDNCLFDHTRFVNVRLWGCSIKNSRFESSDIRETLLGGGNAQNLGSLENVDFHDGKFSQVSFSYPAITGCHFRCDMKVVNFHGSRFKDCSFDGVLELVAFRGRAIPNSNEQYMQGRDIPENRMENIDFSNAFFKDVVFEDAVNLTGCVWPKDGGIFLVKNAHKVFPAALRIIESEWSGEHRRIASFIIKEYYIREIKCGQTQFVIKSEYLTKTFGKEYSDKFTSLLKSLERDEILGVDLRRPLLLRRQRRTRQDGRVRHHHPVRLRRPRPYLLQLHRRPGSEGHLPEGQPDLRGISPR